MSEVRPIASTFLILQEGHVSLYSVLPLYLEYLWRDFDAVDIHFACFERQTKRGSYVFTF